MPRRSNVARASFSRTPKLADEEMALIMPITSETERVQRLADDARVSTF